MAKLNLIRTKLKTDDELLAMTDKQYQHYFERRMRNHPDEATALTRIFQRRNPVTHPGWSLLGDSLDDDVTPAAPRTIAPKGDLYTYKLFEDGSVEVLSGPKNVGNTYQAGSKAANIVAKAAEDPANIAGFGDGPGMSMGVLLAAAAGGFAGYKVSPKYAVPAGGGAALGALAGWFLGKKLTEPSGTAVVVVVASREARAPEAKGFWGDSWGEADDQRFYETDQLGAGTDFGDYGYSVGEMGEDELDAALDDLQDSLAAKGLRVGTPREVSYIGPTTEGEQRFEAVKVRVYHEPEDLALVQILTRAASNNGGLQRSKITPAEGGSDILLISAEPATGAFWSPQEVRDANKIKRLKKAIERKTEKLEYLEDDDADKRPRRRREEETTPQLPPRVRKERPSPQPFSYGLTQIGNINDYWGDSAWGEADDQQFDQTDEFGPSTDFGDYGYALPLHSSYR